MKYLCQPGHSQRSLVPQFYIAKGTVSLLLAEAVEAIYFGLEEEYLAVSRYTTVYMYLSIKIIKVQVPLM